MFNPKRFICVHLIFVILINLCTMTVFASGSSSEKKSSEEAHKLFVDTDHNDYYRQFLKYQDPMFVVLAESYLANKPQFYLTTIIKVFVHMSDDYALEGTAG